MHLQLIAIHLLNMLLPRPGLIVQNGTFSLQACEGLVHTLHLHPMSCDLS